MNNKNYKIMLRVGNPPVNKTFAYDQIIQFIKERLNVARYDIASAVAHKVARELPLDLAAQLLAADAMLLNKEPYRAIEFAERALSISADPTPGLFFKSRIAVQLNNHQEAIKLLDKVIALNNANSNFYFERAEVYLTVGDVDRAIENYSTALDIDVGHVKSLLKLSQFSRFHISDDLLNTVESLVKSGQLNSLDLADAYFALANIYDKKNNLEQQFKNLHAGNELVCASYQYDPAIYHKDVGIITDYFSKEFFVQDFSFEPSYEKLIFIVGMPRSGSTLAEQILCSHSQVSDAGENGFMMYAVNDFARKHSDVMRFPLAIADKNIDKLALIATAYLAAIAPRHKTDFIVDKTLGNTVYVGLIHLLFPNAKFIHTIRHPVANCYGCYKQLFSQGGVPYAYSLDHLAHQYQDDMSLMQHWKTVLPDKVFTLEYESLVADQENTTRNLLAYCELPWEDECLKFYDSSRTVITASNTQVKQKIYSSAVDSWKKYQNYLGPLLALVDDESAL